MHHGQNRGEKKRKSGQKHISRTKTGGNLIKYGEMMLGPSIYDVHTDGGRLSGSGGRMWTGEGWGSKPHVDVHTEI